MNNEDYIVCIISYKRSQNLLTYNTLLKSGYTDFIYIFVSDNDPELTTYQKLYKNVIVFNKQEILANMNIDLYDNFNQLDNCTIARNAILNYAKKNNISNVIILDDDIKSFRARFKVNNSLKSYTINNIKTVFDLYIKYLNSIDKLLVLSFAYPAIFIGGLNGKFSEGYQHLVSQIFIMKVNDYIFKATRNEDEILSISNEYITLTPYIVIQDSVERSTNEGRII